MNADDFAFSYNWYKVIQLGGVCTYTKFERNLFVNIRKQANVNFICFLFVVLLCCLFVRIAVSGVLSSVFCVMQRRGFDPPQSLW